MSDEEQKALSIVRSGMGFELKAFHSQPAIRCYVMTIVVEKKVFTLYPPHHNVTIVRSDAASGELTWVDSTDKLLRRLRRSKSPKNTEGKLWKIVGETATFQVGVPDPFDESTWP